MEHFPMQYSMTTTESVKKSTFLGDSILDGTTGLSVRSRTGSLGVMSDEARMHWCELGSP